MGTITTYILGSTKPLPFFKVKSSTVFANTFDKLEHYFPGLDQANLRGYGRESGTDGHHGLLIGVDKSNITLASYDETLLPNWRWEPTTRGRQEHFFYQLFQGKLRVPFRMRKGVEVRELHPRPPYVIVVDSSALSRKGNPTARKVEEFILKHAETVQNQRVETHILYERNRFGDLLRAEFGLDLSLRGSLDAVVSAAESNTGKNAERAEAFLKYLGDKYASKIHRPDRK